MRVVTDKQGNYAIARYRWIFTQYNDLEHPEFWWFRSSVWVNTCCWGSFNEVMAQFGKLRPRKVNIPN